MGLEENMFLYKIETLTEISINSNRTYVRNWVYEQTLRHREYNLPASYYYKSGHKSWLQFEVLIEYSNKD